MANIIKELIEAKPSINEDEFFGGLELSGLKYTLYNSVRQNLLTDVLAAEEIEVNFKIQFERAVELAEYGFEKEACAVIDYMLAVATEIQPEAVPQVYKYKEQIHGYLAEKHQLILEAHSTVTRWPRNKRIFIEYCTETPDHQHVEAMFCTTYMRNSKDADWTTARIDRESLIRFTVSILKEACTDTPHPVSGEHVQRSGHIDESAAGVSLLEFLENYVKLYIEAGQPIKIIPTK